MITSDMGRDMEHFTVVFAPRGQAAGATARVISSRLAAPASPMRERKISQRLILTTFLSPRSYLAILAILDMKMGNMGNIGNIGNTRI